MKNDDCEQEKQQGKLYNNRGVTLIKKVVRRKNENNIIAKRIK